MPPSTLGEAKGAELVDRVLERRTRRCGSAAGGRAVNLDSNPDIVTEALELYRDRLPRDVTYSSAEMLELARNHLAGKYGPDWKMYFLIASLDGHAVGMLIAYDDLRTNLAFKGHRRKRRESRHPSQCRFGRTRWPSLSGPDSSAETQRNTKR
jgi:hypothetical protein